MLCDYCLLCVSSFVCFNLFNDIKANKNIFEYGNNNLLRFIICAFFRLSGISVCVFVRQQCYVVD